MAAVTAGAVTTGTRTARAAPQASALIGPRLKPHVDSYRHVYRGKVWYVFNDRAAHRTFRVSGEGAEVIGSLDGRRGLDEILATLASRNQEAEAVPPDPAQLSHFVAQLEALDLLDTGAVPDITRLDERRRAARRRSWTGQLRSPMSFRIPLFDPTRLLGMLMPACAWFFTPGGAAVWLAVVGTGAVIGVMNWGVLTADVTDRLLSAENLVVAGMVYPVIKALHELGHGLALRRLGMEVRQVGILFAAFIPTPYVDASSSTVLERRRDRIMVGAAGMAVELFLGGVALILWSLAEPGALRAVCYNVVVISGFSTLLFNGNPLQRYDGYYILSDLIGIPSLGARAGAYVSHGFRRIVLGEASVPPAGSRSERRLFLLYGPASFAYRFSLMLVISFYVAERYPGVGLMLAAWSVIGYVFPAVSGLAGWERRSRGMPSFRRGMVGLLAMGAVLALLLFVAPAPRAVVAQGVVAMPDADEVRPRIAATVASVLVRDGEPVAAGRPVLQLEDPGVVARLARMDARVREMKARATEALAADHPRAAVLAEQTAQAERERADAARDVESLVVRSPASGTLVLPAQADLPRRFVQKGETIATVWDAGRAVVRAVVPLSDADLVRDDVRRADIRPSWDVSRSVPASLLRIVPQATDALPSAVLSLDGGGPFATTRERDNQPKAQEALFEIDVHSTAPLAVAFLNGRVHVRFVLSPEPVGWQLWRAVRLVFLRRLNA